MIWGVWSVDNGQTKDAQISATTCAKLIICHSCLFFTTSVYFVTSFWTRCLHRVPKLVRVLIRPPPAVGGERHCVIGSSIRPSGRPIRVTRSLCICGRDFNETWHKCSSGDWAMLETFSRSEVKGQGHGEIKMHFCGGGLHFDNVLIG